jgi:ADP-ribose pyrophosphatase YjhB (NUDIX family)
MNQVVTKDQTVAVTKTQKQIVVAVAAVVDGRGNVLLTRRNQPELPEAHNKWEMPGGKVEFNEAPDVTAAREVLEETGYQVRIDPTRVSVKAMVWEFAERDIHTILIAYRATIIGGELKIQGGAVSDARWWPIDQIPVPHMLPLDDEFVLELAEE